MNLIFLHGWSVTSTATYGQLPQILVDRGTEKGIKLNLVDISLGRYISFQNEVRMDDVVRALQKALMDTIPNNNGGIQPFACITHSTGGPVARSWVNRYFLDNLQDCPMHQLIMLAPANHGSALATLGSERVGRIKAATDGVEPGDGILKWLELGSDEARILNQDWLTCNPLATNSKFKPYVLTGETIDKKFYDFVNHYLGEKGSDGVVRVAAATLDYRWLNFSESEKSVEMYKEDDGTPVRANLLVKDKSIRQSTPCPFLVIPKASHSGDRIGIMKSPTLENANNKPVVAAILDALSTKSKADYNKLKKEWSKRNATEQGVGRRKRFFQLIVNVRDDQGFAVKDFDFILLSGDSYHPGKLPKGFLVDKQRNKHTPQTITFYLDFDVMTKDKESKFGFRIVGRPNKGFGYYKPVEFRSDAEAIDVFVNPNATHYLDVILKRHVDEQTTRLDPANEGPKSFKKTKPDGIEV